MMWGGGDDGKSDENPIPSEAEQKEVKMFRSSMILIFIAVFLACTNAESADSKEKNKTASGKLEQTIYYGGDIITMEGDKPIYVEAVMERDG